MNKRLIHHFYQYFHQIKAWHLGVALLALSGLSVWELRNNSQRLEPLVAAVVEADRQDGDVDTALRRLGNYVTNHMNTQLDEPVQLAYSYDRATQEVLTKAQATAEGAIYKKAQEVCEDPNVLLSVRALCIQDYVLKHAPPGREPVEVKFPDKAAYTFNFVSPKWSPDLAGWLVALNIMVATLFVAWISLAWWVRRLLQHHL